MEVTHQLSNGSSKSPRFECLLYEVADGVATITFNSPQKLNAVSIEMRSELLTALGDARANDEVKALVLTGAGGNFCSGGDAGSMQSQTYTAEQGRARMADIVASAKMLLGFPKPVIAAVDGVAYGAGLGISLCADFLLATPNARFCAPFMKIGLIPDFACLFSLPRIVGWQRARQIIYSTAEFSGADAEKWGMVSELVDGDALRERALQLAKAMTTLPPTAFQLTKEMLAGSFANDAASACDLEAMAQGMAFNSQYHVEAMARISQRQKPQYVFPVAG